MSPHRDTSVYKNNDYEIFTEPSLNRDNFEALMQFREAGYLEPQHNIQFDTFTPLWMMDDRHH